MTFTREKHRVIAVVLGCLDASVLRETCCYFAGGTAISMRFGEYRESVDIDFIVADPDSYRTLRSACRGPNGFSALTLSGQRVIEAGDLRIDQYGIRAQLWVAGLAVKFEIVREGRITLDEPGHADHVLGIATASVPDLVATKFLANSDRWADRSVFSRDIIDLAMMRIDGPTMILGLRKATAAYGPAAAADAQSAIAFLLDRDHVIDRCRHALDMTEPRAAVVDRLRRLSASLLRASR